jgi:hypothetical protein
MSAKLMKIDVRVVLFVLTIVLFALGAGAPGSGGI